MSAVIDTSNVDEASNKISALTDKMHEDELTAHEAEQLVDLIVMRITTLTVAKSDMDWATVAEALRRNAEIADMMAEEDEVS